MTRMRTPGKASRILTALLWAAGWCALILLDLQTKAAAVRALQGKPPIILVNGVLELLYVQNTGAAFSLLENAQWLFILIAVAAVFLISVFLLPSVHETSICDSPIRYAAFSTVLFSTFIFPKFMPWKIRISRSLYTY